MPKRILCIDDDADIRLCVEFALVAEGYHVETLPTPDAIFRQIREHNPDLILLDIKLGEYDGLEVCRMIAFNPAYNHIPVVMMSADERIHQAVEEYGATDIVEKPFDISTLADTINKHLQARVIDLFPPRRQEQLQSELEAESF